MDKTEFLDYLRTLTPHGDGCTSSSESEVELHVGSEQVTLRGRDIQCFLCSPHHVELVYDALHHPSDCGVVLSEVEVTDEVILAIEERFSYLECA